MRRTFRDDALQSQFEEDGFLVASRFSSQETQLLQSLYETRAPKVDASGFTTTSYVDDIEKGHALSKAALEIVSDKILRILPGHRLVQAAFMVKHPDDRSTLSPHVDPTIVDEAIYQSIVIWIPLLDVDERNGCVWVFPGTHHETPQLRCAVEDLFQIGMRVSQQLAPEIRRPIPVRAGQVLLFHPGLVHGSGPNNSGRLRLALQLYALPEEAEVIQCRMNAEGMIERYRVSDDYMLDVKDPTFQSGGELIDVVDRDDVNRAHRLTYFDRARRLLSGKRA